MDTKSVVGSEAGWIWEKVREELGMGIVKISHKHFLENQYKFLKENMFKGCCPTPSGVWTALQWNISLCLW